VLDILRYWYILKSYQPEKQMTASIITRINAILKKNGRVERLVRGRGYYYLKNCNFRESGIYAWNPYKDANAIEYIVSIFNDEGITLEL